MQHKEKAKILMIIGLFYPQVGGAEKVCQELSQKLRAAGFSVAVLTQYREGLPEHEEIEGIPVYRKIKGWHLFELTYMISVLWFLFKNRDRFDIIQCFGLYLFVPPALAMKYLLGARVVLRILCSGKFGDFNRASHLRYKKLILGCARRLDRIIYLSEESKNELIENHFPPEKLLFISNGVDCKRFSPPREKTGSSPALWWYLQQADDWYWACNCSHWRRNSPSDNRCSPGTCPRCHAH